MADQLAALTVSPAEDLHWPGPHYSWVSQWETGAEVWNRGAEVWNRVPYFQKCLC